MDCPFHRFGLFVEADIDLTELERYMNDPGRVIVYHNAAPQVLPPQHDHWRCLEETIAGVTY